MGWAAAGLGHEGFVRLRNGLCTHGNMLEPIFLESRPQRPLGMDLVYIKEESDDYSGFFICKAYLRVKHINIIK